MGYDFIASKPTQHQLPGHDYDLATDRCFHHLSVLLCWKTVRYRVRGSRFWMLGMLRSPIVNGLAFGASQ